MEVYNFAAGPARLPKEVMKQAQEEFCCYQDSGSGILELSHRGKYFAPVIERAEANIRELMGISDDYAVCFIQGGGSMQFAMIPMNLLNGGTADFIDTGVWSNKASKEAKYFGTANIAASSRETKYDHIPAASEWKLTPNAAYMYITSNNTVAGSEYHPLPKAPAGVPLISDMSSDIMSRVVNVNDFGLIFAGAQKNLGPAGVTLVIIRKDLLARTPDNVPTMLRYSTYVENGSMFNTPPTFAIYMLALTTDYLKKQGGIAAVEKVNIAKAEKLYGFLDSTDFYSTPVAKADRSRMNVVFRTPSDEMDAKFVKEATAQGLTDLKGHRLVGGCRASIYNAMPMAGVDALIDFMKEFARVNG